MRIQNDPDLARGAPPFSARWLALTACAAAPIAVLAAAAGWRGDVPASLMLATAPLALLLPILASRLAWRGEADGPRRPAEDAVPLSAVSDLVTWHDSHGDVERASAASQTIVGVGPASLKGTGLLAQVHIADRPAFLKALSDVANGSPPIAVHFRLHRLDDAIPGVTFVEMRVQALQGRDRFGQAVVIAFTRDVSSHQTRERAIEDARLEAEKANDLKGRFLATVTHELRTPLNAIIGFSELLGADHPFLVTEERRREYAQIIRSSGLHLLEIVNTLLDMSKIETGNFHFDPEAFNLLELTRSVCDLMQLKADEGCVAIERDLADDLPEICADRRACRQILINLLSNALKFTPAGGRVTVHLSATAQLVTLAISDTGIGIPEADLPRLGDPFFQSGDMHRRNQEGTGLGLSVVRGIVGLHHGEITVESGSGAGTTVSVTLPISPEHSAGSAKPVVVQTRARTAPRSIERKVA